MNAQCGAVRRRIPLDSDLQAPNTHNSRRRACQKRESSRRRRELAGLRAQFGDHAMKGTLQLYPTLLVFTNINWAHNGGRSHHAYIGGPRGVLADSRASFCEYAMRGSPRAHPTLLVSPSTNRTYAVMVDVSTVRISEASGVNIAYWRPRFANTQCEAVWRCIALGSRRYAAPNTHQYRRCSCEKR